MKGKYRIGGRGGKKICILDPLRVSFPSQTPNQTVRLQWSHNQTFFSLFSHHPSSVSQSLSLGNVRLGKCLKVWVKNETELVKNSIYFPPWGKRISRGWNEVTGKGMKGFELKSHFLHSYLRWSLWGHFFYSLLFNHVSHAIFFLKHFVLWQLIEKQPNKPNIETKGWFCIYSRDFWYVSLGCVEESFRCLLWRKGWRNWWKEGKERTE